MSAASRSYSPVSRSFSRFSTSSTPSGAAPSLSQADPWEKPKSWSIGIKELFPGYKYTLKHIRLLPKQEQASATSEMREMFRSLAMADTDTNKSRYLPNLWSRLSFFRMSIPRHKRPPLPPNLVDAAKELGMAEGSGYFVATPLRDKDGINIIEVGGPERLQKAKLYNMDLHPADIARHHALNERFHFRGPERFR